MGNIACCCAEERANIVKPKTESKVLRVKSPTKGASKRDQKDESNNKKSKGYEIKSPVKPTAGAVATAGSTIKVLDQTLTASPSDQASYFKGSKTALGTYAFYDVPLENVVGPIHVEYQISEVAAAATYLGVFLE